jgi:hypothetical protein
LQVRSARPPAAVHKNRRRCAYPNEIALRCFILFWVRTSGTETLGGKYELHDLVQLDANTAGVIIGIDKDYARVLTNQSTIAKPDVRMCKVGGQVDSSHGWRDAIVFFTSLRTGRLSGATVCCGDCRPNV